MFFLRLINFTDQWNYYSRIIGGEYPEYYSDNENLSEGDYDLSEEKPGYSCVLT